VNPHWIKIDPDPDPSYLLIFCIYVFISLILMLKLDELFRSQEIFISSRFSIVQIWGLRVKFIIF